MATPPSGFFKRIQSEARVLLDGQTIETQGDAKLSRVQRFLHFWVLVGRNFMNNRCPVRASALAYTTLLALIPLFAVVISVSSSLLKKEGSEPIQRMIDKAIASAAPQLNLVTNKTAVNYEAQITVDPESGVAVTNLVAISGQQEVAKKISEYIGNIQSGALGASGMVGLVFVAIMLLSNIEKTCNDIWGVTRGRTWVSRIIQYWAAITLGPLVLALVIGLTTGPHLDVTQQFVSKLGPAGEFMFELFLLLLPFIILCTAFGLFYKVMPNTKVQMQAAMVGGLVGGILWQLNNMFNVIYVSKVVTYSKIYGSFGMVPVFLVGMYFSWLILLFGAQVAYVYQNRKSYLQEKQAESVNQTGREFIALRMMTRIGEKYERAEKPPGPVELAETLGIPGRLVTQLVGTLGNVGLVAEVMTSKSEIAYVPGRPLAQISAQDILRALRTAKGQELQTTEGEDRQIVRAQFDRIKTAESQVANAVTLEKMVADVQVARSKTIL